MADTYVHGIVFDSKSGSSRRIVSPSSSVIGIVGTAPSSVATFLAEAPTVFFKEKSALLAAYPSDAKGDKGTLPDAIKGAFSKGDVTVVLIKAKTGSDTDIGAAIEKLSEAESITGYKPKILCIPGFGNTNPTAPKVVSPAPDPVAAPVTEALVTNSPKTLGK